MATAEYQRARRQHSGTRTPDGDHGFAVSFGGGGADDLRA